MDTIPAQRIMINSCKMPEIKYQKVRPCVGSFCFQDEKKFLERESRKAWNNYISCQLKILLPKPQILEWELFELKNLWVLFPSISFCK